MHLLLIFFTLPSLTRAGTIVLPVVLNSRVLLYAATLLWTQLEAWWHSQSSCTYTLSLKLASVSHS